MKLFGYLIILLTGSIGSFAQAAPTNVDFRKAQRPALFLPLEFNPGTAEQTILAKLKETGYKPERSGNFLNKKNKEEGFYKFTGVVLPELDNEKLDLYFKVDPMNSNADRSSITLLVSKGYDNFVSTGTDSATYMAAEKFLNGFVQGTNAFDINQKLDEQKKSVAASEKKRTDLQDSQTAAKKKLAELEAEIKMLQEEEALQAQDVEKQRSELKDLEARRTSAQK